MATSVEETKTIEIDGNIIEMRPLKIKKLRAFMNAFDDLVEAGSDNDKSLDALVACTVIAMEQYEPKLAKASLIEDNFDLTDLYKVVEAAAGIKLGDDGGKPQTAQVGMI